MSASSPPRSPSDQAPPGSPPPQNSSATPSTPTSAPSSTPPARDSPPARSPPFAPPNSPTDTPPPSSPSAPLINPSPSPIAASPPPAVSPPPSNLIPPSDPSASSPPAAQTASAPPPPQDSTPPLTSSPPPQVQLTPPSTPTNPIAQPPPPFRSTHTSPPQVTRSPNARSPPTGSSHPAPKSATGNVSTGNGSGSGPKFSTTTFIGIAVAGAILLGIIAMLLLCLVRKRSRKRSYHADNYEHSSGQYQTKAGSYEARRKPRYESPYSSSEVRGKPQPPLSGQSSGPTQAHVFTTTYDSGSATEAPSPRKFAPPPPPPGRTSSIGSSKAWFTFEELEEATQGFSRSNLLGQGGFGYVFKGVLPGGLIVAVKRLKVGGKQGEREFQAEVETISRAHHRHLVALIGYCIADSQRLLVYEYVSNGTLESHLHGKGQAILDWKTRVKIAIGAARGLAYLHEDCQPRIIHRDIKSSNILLDDHFEAKVADFGLAKYASDTHSHVSTRVMGTFGYLAPEYASTGKLTDKSDVFSFGVVLLELLTGRKPIDSSRPLGNESLVEWAQPLLTQALDDGILIGLVDARLDNEYDLQEVQLMIEIAAACVHHSANKRPKMIQVVRALEDGGADISSGLRPGHSSRFGSPYGNVDYENSREQSQLSRLQKMALGASQDQSAYSGVTSEYGLNPSISASEQRSSKEIDSRHHESDEKRWG